MTVKKIFSVVGRSVLIFISVSIFSVILFRFVNPPLTPLMVIRHFQPVKSERKFLKDWESLDEISPNMVQAVVAAEDNNFTTHYGIDWEAVKKAMERNKRRKRMVGASTISQQTVKNVFLVPARTFIRKGFEVYFTFLAETVWGKHRIMEVYLNVIELGPGIYGVEAASQYYFHKSAQKLSRNEAALLTSVLPSPRKRNAAKPTGYMMNYQARVLSLMNKIPKVEL